ncbi:MAG: SDR family NAD(P)-dependent oxidoreductase [Candidatus Competibacteraceae bacterium]|nr:SDR family NAD(P)-dependent oxidoreductase [Candidatus Competibacteraceae bacterium]
MINKVFEKDAMNHFDDDFPIAVVGIGCRFPGGSRDPESFWRFLREVGNGITKVPADRWSLDAFYDENPDAIARSTTKWGGFLDDIKSFDPGFFDISPREAKTMDPQQRLILQVAYEAAQDANIPVALLSAAVTGVFVGVSTSDYATLQKYQRTNKEIYAGTGSALSIISNRVAHRLNLRGPAYSVDTACSSSLVALDQACRNLRSGACEVALAGGVNILADPSAFIAFSKANFLSQDGQLSTFDARANGYVRGEGAGMVVLKPLQQAMADDNRIYAVIRATRVNQDGRTVTLTSPNPEAQIALLQGVCEAAGISPAQVAYVEAHGTGTPVGDPIEATAIGRVFGKVEREQPVLIGSVKPNIGHLESAAGISGFIKVALSIYHGMVPSNRNFKSPNPNIPMDGLNLQVPLSETSLPVVDGVCRAVVNSFGFGGTNACALLESAPPSVTPATVSDAVNPPSPYGRIYPVPISAADTDALANYAGLLAKSVDSEGSLAQLSVAEIANIQGRFRDHLDQRAVVLAHSTVDLADKLKVLQQGEEWPSTSRDDIPQIIQSRTSHEHKLVFTFAGQGGQWWKMGRRLLLEEPCYRRAIDEFDAVFQGIAGWSVVDEMLADEKSSRVDEAAVTQPTIFAVQIGLAALWQQRGIEPDIVIGHSFGEVAAAYIAGAISLQTAAVLIHKRGLIKDQAGSQGAMAVVALAPEQLTPFLPMDGSVGIAAFNGPAMATISGAVEGVQQTLRAIEAYDPAIFTRYLKMDFAWHSSALEPVESWFLSAVGELTWQMPRIPIVSTVTGMLETVFDASYWWRNLRQPVCYTAAIESALELAGDTFIELGPHRTLSGLTTGIAQACDRSPLIINSLHREQDDFEALAYATGALYVAGVEVNWAGFTPAVAAKSVSLPKYPWNNESLWMQSEEARHILFDAPVHPLLGQRDKGPTPSWSNEITLTSHRYITDHNVAGQAVFPGAGYIEMMLAAVRDHFGEGCIELENIQFLTALGIEQDDDVLLRTELDPVRGFIRIYSRKRDTESDWTLRASGKARQRDLMIAGDIAPPLTAPAVQQAGFYTLAEQHGLIYGPQFQGVAGVWLEDSKHGLASIERPAALTDDMRQQHMIHPALFDAGLQSPIPAMDQLAGRWSPDSHTADAEIMANTDDSSSSWPLMLPIQVRRVLYQGAAPARFWVRYELDDTVGSQSATYTFCNADGVPFLSVEGFESREFASDQDAGNAGSKTACFYQEQLVPVQLPSPEVPAGRYLLLAAENSKAEPICTALAERGAIVETVSVDWLNSTAHQSLCERITTLSEDAAGLAGILWIANYPGDLASTSSSADILHYVEQNTFAVIGLGQVLDRLRELEHRPFFALLSCGARFATDDTNYQEASLVQAAVVGLERVLASELSEFRGIQIDADAAAFADGSLIAEAILADCPETELLIRSGAALAPRLEPVSNEALPARSLSLSAKDKNKNFLVTMNAPGVLDRLILRQSPMPRLQSNEALLRVHAVGLNFRDIMAATGLLPEQAELEPAWQNLGLEFGAVVEAIGSDVTHLRPGDRVMGMGRRCLQRYIAMPAEGLIAIPATIDLAQAATIPSAFVTAHYALNHVARLQAGEKVLIHLATGGVGLAAIQLAQRAGAEIFATAGSDAKRDYLRQLGIKHVMNSRALDFADEILAATDGQGVDVILNALPSAFIEKGLDCLAPYGRFLEIGKRDVYADSPIGLKALRRNGSFAVIDLAAMGHDRPQLLASLFSELMELFQTGELKPIAMTLFGVAEVAEAFRFMSQAQHIGKVVVDLTGSELAVEVDRDKPIELDRNGTYLVTGGSRGVGVAVANWLSERGAGKLVLASRRGMLEEEEIGQRIIENGAELESVALDIVDSVAVTALIQRLVADSKPLRGIIHGAAVIEDGLLYQLDAEQIQRVIRPKVAGAWNLHTALQETGADIDFLVSFSSIAAVLGSMGQSNYVAANAFLDAFAQYRAQQGLPAGTIAWGALGDTGFVARNEAMMSYLESSGFGLIPISKVTEALEQFINTSTPVLALAAIDWPQIGRTNPKIKDTPRLAGLVSGQHVGGTRIRSELAVTPREGWPQLLADFIQAEVAKVLQVEAKQVSTTQSLTEIGLDSLSSFELMHRLEAELSLGIPVAKFLQTPTVEGLVEMLTVTLEASFAEAENSAAKGSDGDSQSQTGVADVLQALPRQQLALQEYSARMTSDWGRAGLFYRWCQDVPVSLSVEVLQERYAELVDQYDVLRLGVESISGKTWQLMLVNEPPAFEDPVAASLPAVKSGQSLWRIGVAYSEQGGRQLELSCHAAAGDRYTLQRLAAHLLGECELTNSDVTSSFTNYLNTQTVLTESVAWQAHRAYWAEVLHDCPPALDFGIRQRALAPIGLGCNHGPARVVQFVLPVLRSEQEPLQREALMLAAYVQAVAAAANSTRLIIERLDTVRRASSEAVIGPIAGSLVLPCDVSDANRMQQQLAKLLEQCLVHREFDTACCLMEFQQTLRAMGSVPTQIGFAYIGRDFIDRSEQRLAGNNSALSTDADQAVCRHDLLLTVQESDTQLVFQLRYDTDVFSDAASRQLAMTIGRTVLEQLAEGEEASANVRIEITELPLAAITPVDALITDKLAVATELQAPVLNSGRLPLSVLQAGLVHKLSDPDISDEYRRYWMLSKALFVQPGLDLNRLKRAFEQIVARHENLRMRFTHDNDGWFSVIDEQHPVGIKVHDVGPLDDAELYALIEHDTNQLVDIEHDSLLSVSLYRCGERGDALLLRVHHLISDGWSYAYLLSEVLQAYMGVPLPSYDGPTQRQFVEQFQRVDDMELQVQRTQFWRDRMSPAIAMPKAIGRISKGAKPNVMLNDGGPVEQFTAILSAQGTQIVAEQARRIGVTETALLIAAFSRVIAEVAQVDALYIHLPMAGRSDARLSKFVGWVASVTIIRCDVAQQGTLERLAKDIMQQIIANEEYLPAPLDAPSLPFLHVLDEFTASGAYPGQFIVSMLVPEGLAKLSPLADAFLGEAGAAVDFGGIRIESMPVGKRSSILHELDVRSFKANGVLKYQASYDLTAFDKHEVQNLLQQIFQQMGLKPDQWRYDFGTEETAELSRV